MTPWYCYLIAHNTLFYWSMSLCTISLTSVVIIGSQQMKKIQLISSVLSLYSWLQCIYIFLWYIAFYIHVDTWNLDRFNYKLSHTHMYTQANTHTYTKIHKHTHIQTFILLLCEYLFLCKAVLIITHANISHAWVIITILYFRFWWHLRHFSGTARRKPFLHHTVLHAWCRYSECHHSKHYPSWEWRKL